MSDKSSGSNQDKFREAVLSGRSDDDKRMIEKSFEGTKNAPQFQQSSIQFGDMVRVKNTPETERLGLAGLSGPVFGQTIPSSSGADVIGSPNKDYAISVFFEDRGVQLWFAEDLLELVK